MTVSLFYVFTILQGFPIPRPWTSTSLRPVRNCGTAGGEWQDWRIQWESCCELCMRGISVVHSLWEYNVWWSELEPFHPETIHPDSGPWKNSLPQNQSWCQEGWWLLLHNIFSIVLEWTPSTYKNKMVNSERAFSRPFEEDSRRRHYQKRWQRHVCHCPWTFQGTRCGGLGLGQWCWWSWACVGLG